MFYLKCFQSNLRLGLSILNNFELTLKILKSIYDVRDEKKIINYNSINWLTKTLHENVKVPSVF